MVDQIKPLSFESATADQAIAETLTGERCPDCARRVGLAHGGLYLIGEDRRPKCRDCFDTARRELGYPMEAYPRCMDCTSQILGSCREGKAGLLCHRCYDRTPTGQREIFAMRKRWEENHRRQHAQSRASTPAVADLAAHRTRRDTTSGSAG